MGIPFGRQKQSLLAECGLPRAVLLVRSTSIIHSPAHSFIQDLPPVLGSCAHRGVQRGPCPLLVSLGRQFWEQMGTGLHGLLGSLESRLPKARDIWKAPEGRP